MSLLSSLRIQPVSLPIENTYWQRKNHPMAESPMAIEMTDSVFTVIIEVQIRLSFGHMKSLNWDFQRMDLSFGVDQHQRVDLLLERAEPPFSSNYDPKMTIVTFYCSYRKGGSTLLIVTDDSNVTLSLSYEALFRNSVFLLNLKLVY